MRDRRQDPRRLLSENIQLCWQDPGGEDVRCEGILRDLSISGARIHLPRAVRTQTLVTFTVKEREMHGKVQYCTRAPGKYVVGVVFAEGAEQPKSATPQETFAR